MRKPVEIVKTHSRTIGDVKRAIVGDIIDRIDEIVGHLPGYKKYDLTEQVPQGGTISFDPAPNKETLILAHDGMVLREGYDFVFTSPTQINFECELVPQSYLIAFYKESLKEKMP